MIRKCFFVFALICLLLVMNSNSIIYANELKSKTGTNILISNIAKVNESLEANDIESASNNFRSFKSDWTKTNALIRADSEKAHGIIESNIALLSLSLLNEDINKAREQALTLSQTLQEYSEGTLQTDPNKIEKKSLAKYIQLLEQTKVSLEKKDLVASKQKVEQLQKDWLGVEGDVVSQSQSVYNLAEQSLLLLGAYVKDEASYTKAIQTIDKLNDELKPLQKNSFGIWDAAFIPIREGVEALLVVGALLTVIKKSNVNNGRRWIWGGTIAGLLTSLGIGFVVAYFLQNIAFGQNNFLINGWSGVIASFMLLYVSYWLHRNSNVQQWNRFIKGKTDQAISNGKVISFAVLAFLAILREGLETVIFLIGMVNKMPLEKFLLGILLGFGILIIIGVLMLSVGARLPLRPFFLASSLIVFYLCVKFMGTGIHSLQLSGLMESSVTEWLPTISFIGVYPSWYSTIPQLCIVLLAIGVVIYGFIKKLQSTEKMGGTLS